MDLRISTTRISTILGGGALGLALALGGATLADVGPATKLGPDGIVFANVSISVKDLDLSTKFYQALGFEAGDLHAIPGPVAHALGAKAKDAKLEIRFLKRDGVVLELIHLTPTPKRPASGGSSTQLGLAHIAFRVDNVDRIAAIIKANGGGAVESSRTRLGPPGQGIDILFCTDPDGTIVEIAGPVKG
jgi:catechol 2,3-dioxygenase-like lactoylglutathione lyase family enzyme